MFPLCVLLSAGYCVGLSQAPENRGVSSIEQVPRHIKLKVAPIKQLPAEAGKEMYASYCASCHGENGKGTGPAAPALHEAVPDLTLLAAHNRGIYPKQKVIIALSKYSESHTFGSRSEMPDWYKAFVSLDRACPMRADQRAYNISGFVETLQAAR